MTASIGCRREGFAHWSLAAALALGMHAACAWQLVSRPASEAEAAAGGALILELAPVAVARQDVPVDLPNGPDQVQAMAAPDQAQPSETPPLAEPRPATPVPEAVPPLAQAPDPDPLPMPEVAKETAPAPPAPPPSPPAPATTATQVEAERKAAVAAAPVQGLPGAPPSMTLPRWTSRLLEQLERSKRYPTAATKRREEGTAHVVFAIDRRGNLLSLSIQKSSGSEALDDEALQILRRAQPFPPPPAELPGDPLSLAVPIKFRVR